MAPLLSPTLLPTRLALIDDDVDFSEYLAQFLRDKQIATDWFADSDDLLCSEQPFGFDFYIVDLMLPGVDGLSLLRLLRKRSQAGVLVVSGKQSDDVFEAVLAAGADMYLAKPVTVEQVFLAIGGIYRRSARSAAVAPAEPAWRLDAVQRVLITPAGSKIDLSPTDFSVLLCLLEAEGATVTREKLAARLGLSADDDSNLLSASIYRLRRRIERTTTNLTPLQAKSRSGYVFRAPLLRA